MNIQDLRRQCAPDPKHLLDTFVTLRGATSRWQPESPNDARVSEGYAGSGRNLDGYLIDNPSMKLEQTRRIERATARMQRTVESVNRWADAGKPVSGGSMRRVGRSLGALNRALDEGVATDAKAARPTVRSEFLGKVDETVMALHSFDGLPFTARDWFRPGRIQDAAERLNAVSSELGGRTRIHVTEQTVFLDTFRGWVVGSSHRVRVDSNLGSDW